MYHASHSIGDKHFLDDRGTTNTDRPCHNTGGFTTFQAVRLPARTKATTDGDMLSFRNHANVQPTCQLMRYGYCTTLALCTYGEGNPRHSLLQKHLRYQSKPAQYLVSSCFWWWKPILELTVPPLLHQGDVPWHKLQGAKTN